MSWKQGDYFGSDGTPIEEQSFPVVTITSPQGESTVFQFTSAGNYQEFIVWATWWPMQNGHTLTIEKKPRMMEEWARKRSDAETQRYDQMMRCFRSYVYGDHLCQ